MSAAAVLSPWEYAARQFEPKPRRYASPLALARYLTGQGRDEAEDIAAGLLSAANRI